MSDGQEKQDGRLRVWQALRVLCLVTRHSSRRKPSNGALERIIKMPPAPNAAYLLEQLRVVPFVRDEVGLCCIHDQQRRCVIFVEEACIRFLQSFQVRTLD